MDVPTFRVAIIGAGITGIAQAVRLKTLLGGKISFTVFERASAPGGNWRQAKWPGASSDVPIMLYELEGEPKSDWSRKYPQQPEILEYWESLIQKHNLGSNFRYDTEYIGSEWSANDQMHTITFRQPNGNTFTHDANVVISASGPLSTTVLPKLPGLETYKGIQFHALDWDETIDFRHKKVAVIGNGSTGIQIVPSMSQLEGVEITQFIRSGCYLIPKVDENYSSFFKSALRCIPGLQTYCREKEFRANYGSLATEVSQDPTFFMNYLSKYMKKSAPEKYLSILTPDYPFACKRPAFDFGWLASLHRENVQLVNSKIVAVGENGLLTEDGVQREFDVIIFATGSDIAEQGVGLNIGLKGEAGLELKEHWRAIGGPQAYMGTAVPKFPNVFAVLGPNAVAGSWGHTVSVKTTFVARLVAAMVHHELSSLEPTQTAFTKQNAILDEILAQTPMKSPLCTNWYRTEQGRITVSSTLSASELEEEVREIKWEDWVAREVVESDGKTTADIVDMASRPRLAEVQERQGTAIAALVALVVIRSGRVFDWFLDCLKIFVYRVLSKFA